MCNFIEGFKKHSFAILLIGLVLLFVPIFIISNNSTILSFTAILGVILFVVGTMSYIYQKISDENPFRPLYGVVTILALTIWIIVSFSSINPSDAGGMIGTFITIDIAMLSITFAVLAINSENLIKLLENNPRIDLSRFKIFIEVTALTILFSVFVYVLNFFPFKQEPTLIIQIIGISIPIYIRSFMFGLTSFFTLILLFLFVYYTSIILDLIIRTPSAENNNG